MTENNTSASAGDPLTQADVQDPLPEGNWIWRRAYTYALTIATLALIWFGVDALWKLREGASLHDITQRLIWLLAAVLTYYMVAPSAEQITRMIQSARIIRGGGTITRSAAAEGTEGRATATTVAQGSPAEEVDAAPRSNT